MRSDLHEANRLSWNAATAVHNQHKGDQEAFFQQGGSTLFPEEIDLLGELRGRTLVHLQCNAGQDTLSLARLGADVTGVDISDEAIRFARQLSSATGIPATFHRADVYDWLGETARGTTRFDVVFCSYGALCWLSDLSTWAEGVAAVLRPGGRFVCVEFHPFVLVFNEQWELRYDYFCGGEPLMWEDGVGDYVADSGEGLSSSGTPMNRSEFRNSHPSYEFPWSLSEVVAALLQAGLVLRVFREYPFMNGWRAFETMREVGGRRWAPPEGVPRLPLMYGLVAEKPEPRRA